MTSPSRQTITSALVTLTTITETISMSGVNLYVGDQSIITCTVTDVNGNVQDPGSVTAAVRTPDGAITSQAVTRVSQGTYQFTYMWAQQFGHTVQFQGTAPYPFNTYQPFSVLASPF